MIERVKERKGDYERYGGGERIDISEGMRPSCVPINEMHLRRISSRVPTWERLEKYSLFLLDRTSVSSKRNDYGRLKFLGSDGCGVYGFVSARGVQASRRIRINVDRCYARPGG